MKRCVIVRSRSEPDAVQITLAKSCQRTLVCLEDRFGNAEDLVFPWKKKLLGGFELERPTFKVAEPRVYGPKGDELGCLGEGKN